MPSNNKICPSCNIEYPESASFCRSCGGKLTVTQGLSAEFQAEDSVFKIKLSDTPDDPSLILEYSDFLLKNCLYQEAISVMNEFLEKSPKSINIRNSLAMAHKASGDMEAYIAQLLIIEKFSKNDDLGVQYDLAKAYYDNNNIQQASTKIDIILNVDPNHIDAQKLKAHIYLTQNELSAYTSLLTHVLKLKQDIDIANELCNHYWESSEIDKIVSLIHDKYLLPENNPKASLSLVLDILHKQISGKELKLDKATRWLDLFYKNGSISKQERILADACQQYINLSESDVEYFPNEKLLDYDWKTVSNNDYSRSIVARTLFLIGESYLDSCNFNLSLKAFQTSDQINNSPEARSKTTEAYIKEHFTKANDYLEQGNYAAALINFELVAKRETEAHHSLLKYFKETKNNIEAIQKRSTLRRNIMIVASVIVLGALLSLYIFIIAPIYRQDTIACEKAKETNTLEAWQEYLENIPLFASCESHAKRHVTLLESIVDKYGRRPLSFITQNPSFSIIEKYIILSNTVLDMESMTLWQKRAMNEASHREAIEYCRNLDLDGQTNWILPTRDQFNSIKHYGQHSNCYWDGRVFSGFCKKSGYNLFWSSDKKPETRNCNDCYYTVAFGNKRDTGGYGVGHWDRRVRCAKSL